MLKTTIRLWFDKDVEEAAHSYAATSAAARRG